VLEAALIALALLCVALGIVCHGLYRNQQRMLAEQAKRDAVHEARIKELGKRLDAYLAGSIRMGEELHELRRVVAPLPDKLSQIEQRDPSSLSFTQAARLVGMGASVDDLTQSCGLSQAEAELISRLHQSKTP
jgi:hypothetical protein